MSMQKIKISRAKEIAKKYSLTPCKVQGKEIVNIRKYNREGLEDISWEDFETILKKRKLAVYKADKSDFLKVMKDR